MTRRQFHRFGAATLAAALPLNVSAASFDYPWQLGIISDQVDFDLSRVLDTFYAKYHLRWTEIRYLKLGGSKRYVYAEATPSQLKEIRAQLDPAGIKLSVLDTAIYKIVLPGTTPAGEMPAYVDSPLERFDRQLEDLKRAAAAAHTLGTNRLRIFTFRRVVDPSAVFDRVVEQLEKALDVAKQQDVTLLVENEYDCNIGTGEETAKLFRAIADRRLMHNWDPCNIYMMGEQPFPKAWNLLDHSRISHIHLKDAKGKSWEPIGAGAVDLAGQFKALKDMKYAGTLSLETRYRDSEQDAYRSSVESMNGLAKILARV